MSGKTIQLHNVPPQSTPFIGREPEIAEIVHILQDDYCRLLTLVGAGGMGKTRLAIESIRRLTSDDFEHGVFYIPLAPLSSADPIAMTVISVLGIMIGDDGTLQQELVKFLSQRNLLLVMDNFEHILDGADLVADILNYAPHVKILATSREQLNLRIERLWHVRGMPFPALDDLNDSADYDALTLFNERAIWIRHDFSIETQHERIIHICQLVGGMPLGIELAASWLKTLSCQDIIKQLERSIDFLSTRTRDIPERHRSIRAVFNHSWQLLSADEQAVFPRLSVFRGGFTLEAAEQVANASLMTLSGLVEKSMVRRDETGRYDLHELLRQCGNEKLIVQDEIVETLSAHMSYFAEFVAQHTPDIKGRRQRDGLNEVEADFDNIIVAWQQTIVSQNYSVLDQMIEGIVLYSDLRAKYSTGIHLLKHAINHLNLDDSLIKNRLRVRYIQIQMTNEADLHIENELLLQKYLSVAQQHDDQLIIGICLWLLGEVKRIRREFADALDRYDHAMEFFSNYRDDYYVGRALRGIVYSQNNHGTPDAEVRNFAIEQARNTGDYCGLTHALTNNLAFVDVMTAQSVLSEIITIASQMGEVKNVGMASWFSARDACLNGRFDEAKVLIDNSTQILNDIGVEVNIVPVISGVISIFRGENVSNINEVISSAESYKVSKHYRDRDTMHKSLSYIIMAWYDHKQFGYYILEALRFASDPLVPLAAATCVAMIALMQTEDEEYRRATQLMGLAFTYSDEYLMGWMTAWDQLTHARTTLQTKLGEDTFNQEWIRGEALDLEVTIENLIDMYGGTTVKSSNAQSIIDPLTPKQLDVLRAMVNGKTTDRELAAEFVITEGTVRSHIHAITQKLSAKNRTEAVLRAQEFGLCD